MSWISAEAEKLAYYMEVEDTDYRFPAIDSSCDSYFEDYDMEEVAVEEFGIVSIPGLRKLLQKKRVIHSMNIDSVCAIAAFKNRTYKDVEEKEEYVIPTFIYNF